MTRWWNGQTWTDHLTVSGHSMTVENYRRRARITAIVSSAIAAVFVLAMVILAFATRSSAVLWAVTPWFVIYLGAAATLLVMTSNMRKQIQATGVL